MARNRPHRPSVDHDSSKGCRVAGCGRKVAAQGMCWGHYRRELRGSPVLVDLAVRGENKRVSAVRYGPKNAPYRVRRLAMFEWWLREALVTPEPNTGCLLWLGEFHDNGYGVVGNFDDPWGRYAHRAALHFAGVRLRKGHSLHVRHSCNNPGCVNVAHLSYGGAWENMRDRALRFGHGTLTPEAVIDIRAALGRGELLRVIAARHGVSVGAVTAIQRGRSWAWLTKAPAPQVEQNAA